MDFLLLPPTALSAAISTSSATASPTTAESLTGPTGTTAGSGSLSLSLSSSSCASVCSKQSHSSKQRLLEDHCRHRAGCFSPPCPDVDEQRPPVTTVEVPPPAAPYAQLCFNQAQDQLITLLVRTTTNTSASLLQQCSSTLSSNKKYFALQQDSEVDLPLALSRTFSSSSSSEIAHGSSKGGDVGISWSYSDDSASANFSSCSSDSSSLNYDFDCTPQEIVWLDESWLFETDSSDCSDIRVSLLHDYVARSAAGEVKGDGFDGASAEMLTGCAKFFRALCSAKAKRQRLSRSARAASPKTERKSFSYSVLKG